MTKERILFFDFCFFVFLFGFFPFFATLPFPFFFLVFFWRAIGKRLFLQRVTYDSSSLYAKELFLLFLCLANDLGM